jgi:hypothetical protein
MTDWAAMARARGIDLPAEEVERLAASQSALEAVLRPLAAGLKPEEEPDVQLHLEDGAE